GGFLLYQNYERNPRAKPSWVWEVRSKKAGEFLKLVLPYLQIKKPQAELAIQFQEGIKPRQYKYHPKTEAELAVEEAQSILMHSLNK
ncbi:MAG: hypothetical protein KKD77_21445, partial [Gammaproteobacteria bacterium]|nr:hypothetical protein [Gammaproteobacteria bacterium]